jgi:hypothetical protein
VADTGSYVDPGGHFALAVPTGWGVYENTGGTLVAIAEPPPPDRPDFAANVNVLHYTNERGLDTEALVAESIETMRVLLTDFVLLEQDVEEERPRVLFAFRQGLYALTADQRYVVGEGDYYVVTSTTKAGGDPIAETTASAVLESFQILEPWTAQPA